MNILDYVGDYIQKISWITVLISILAIWFAWKSQKILKAFKAKVEVFFEKERMLQGYTHHIELFKPLLYQPEDIELLKRDIIKYQLDIKQIFLSESEHEIIVYNCDWVDVRKNKLEHYYTIKIIKEKYNRNMPQIYYPNEKIKIGRHSLVVKVLKSNDNSGLLSDGEFYFIYFRLGSFREQPTSPSKIQGYWLITKTVDKNNTKYPFLFFRKPDKSFALTADEFMRKRR